MAQQNPVESNDVRPKIQESKSWFFKLRYSVFLGEMLVLLKNSFLSFDSVYISFLKSPTLPSRKWQNPIAQSTQGKC